MRISLLLIKVFHPVNLTFRLLVADVGLPLSNLFHEGGVASSWASKSTT